MAPKRKASPPKEAPTAVAAAASVDPVAVDPKAGQLVSSVDVGSGRTCHVYVNIRSKKVIRTDCAEFADLAYGFPPESTDTPACSLSLSPSLAHTPDDGDAAGVRVMYTVQSIVSDYFGHRPNAAPESMAAVYDATSADLVIALHHRSTFDASPEKESAAPPPDTTVTVKGLQSKVRVFTDRFAKEGVLLVAIARTHACLRIRLEGRPTADVPDRLLPRYFQLERLVFCPIAQLVVEGYGASPIHNLGLERAAFPMVELTRRHMAVVSMQPQKTGVGDVTFFDLQISTREQVIGDAYRHWFPAVWAMTTDRTTVHVIADRYIIVLGLRDASNKTYGRWFDVHRTIAMNVLTPEDLPMPFADLQARSKFDSVVQSADGGLMMRYSVMDAEGLGVRWFVAVLAPPTTMAVERYVPKWVVADSAEGLPKPFASVVARIYVGDQDVRRSDRRPRAVAVASTDGADTSGYSRLMRRVRSHLAEECADHSAAAGLPIGPFTPSDLDPEALAEGPLLSQLPVRSQTRLSLADIDPEGDILEMTEDRPSRKAVVPIGVPDGDGSENDALPLAQRVPPPMADESSVWAPAAKRQCRPESPVYPYSDENGPGALPSEPAAPPPGPRARRSRPDAVVVDPVDLSDDTDGEHAPPPMPDLDLGPPAVASGAFALSPVRPPRNESPAERLTGASMLDVGAAVTSARDYVNAVEQRPAIAELLRSSALASTRAVAEGGVAGALEGKMQAAVGFDFGTMLRGGVNAGRADPTALRNQLGLAPLPHMSLGQLKASVMVFTDVIVPDITRALLKEMELNAGLSKKLAELDKKIRADAMAAELASATSSASVTPVSAKVAAMSISPTSPEPPEEVVPKVVRSNESLRAARLAHFGCRN